MAERALDIRAWLNSLPTGTRVGIAEDGMCLKAFRKGKLLDVYYEIGGIPVEIEHGDACRCDECKPHHRGES